MFTKKHLRYIGIVCLSIGYAACTIPKVVTKTENKITPDAYTGNKIQDSISTGQINWKLFFTDPFLQALIDTAFKNNQELNIVLQEIEISRNEIRARKGEYLPSVGLRAGGALDKVSRYTNIGAMEATTDMEPGKPMPEPVPDYSLNLFASWELDIWRKLRNAKKAAVFRYLATVEGKNFAATNLVAEVAASYYELLAFDNELEIVKQNIELQTNALEIVQLQKNAARVTELAVRRFEAQLWNTKSLQYTLQQKITETENRINFLLGRYPQPVARASSSFEKLSPPLIKQGVPSQLLVNRPDIRKAEQELAAAKLDVQVARAKFYPSIGIAASVGYRAFNPAYLINPESLLYTLAGELTAPLVNRNAIKAAYYSANSTQIQAVYNYERTILNAYTEVVNQLNKISNLTNSYHVKEKQVDALSQSVTISNDLFKSARADYMEVLLTQRDALEARFELIETKMQQLNATVNIYRALGGGWN